MSSIALSQFQQLRSDLASRFPERREMIEGALAAVLASEHCLLIGPPDP
jgi:MoxR-like ATPase